MQDLGNINITIRGAVGGGGMGVTPGTPGGGPRLLPSDDDEAGVIPTLVRGQQEEKKKPTVMQSIAEMLGKVAKGEESKEEISAFLGQPTLVGLANLASETSATGAALNSLSGSLAMLGPALIGVLLAAGGMIIAFKAMAFTAQYTADRIEKVGKYSGVAMNAIAMERVSSILRDLQDASFNGAIYAKSQVAATASSDAQARTMLYANQLMAEAAIALSNVTETLWTIAGNVLKPLVDFKDMLGVSVGDIFAQIGKTIFGYLLFGQIGSFFGPQIWNALQAILNYMGIVVQNTKPAMFGGRGANGWMMSDLESLGFPRMGWYDTGLMPRYPQVSPGGLRYWPNP